MTGSKKKNILIISPHPDDETLGCGGTLLRHKMEGDQIDWVIVTEMHSKAGFSPSRVEQREREIEKVANAFQFHKVHRLGFPTTNLEEIPRREIVQAMSNVFQICSPQIIYLPFPGDIHTDHRMVFESAMACCKWFRQPGIERILVYEVLSETELSPNTLNGGFQPNIFIEITPFLDEKIRILNLFQGEVSEFPFPRSEVGVRALASFRGLSAGVNSAEAFVMIKEVLTNGKL
ncbi:MAG: PIG-L family deacetylase [Candidatus Riflebacteria bacterium]|nr:PIG-L family deacetylase [Candidatus Riflebacteria bacterium]